MSRNEEILRIFETADDSLQGVLGYRALFLHVLHKHIQEAYFDVARAYDYREFQKGIEWNRVLWGNAKVKFVKLGFE